MDVTLDTDDRGRPIAPPHADELTTPTGSLELERATLARKTDGVDDAGLRTTVGASTMTLGGVLVHLAFVEDFWTTYRLHGRRPTAPWDTVDCDPDPDADRHLAAELTGAEIRERWTTAVERSRAHVAECTTVVVSTASRPPQQCARR